jgi:hypothetical protein
VSPSRLKLARWLHRQTIGREESWHGTSELGAFILPHIGHSPPDRRRISLEVWAKCLLLSLLDSMRASWRDENTNRASPSRPVTPLASIQERDSRETGPQGHPSNLATRTQCCKSRWTPRWWYWIWIDGKEIRNIRPLLRRSMWN